jgi:hypothetical protein
MNEPRLRNLAEKMRDTYESGKPVVTQLQERWQEHRGLLAMIRFMYTLSEDEVPLRQKVVEQLDQLSRDMDATFSMLGSYHYLTQVFVLLEQEHGEERESE